ncbi:MAG: hypothetical protein CBB68_03210 [Rhodospirillaceae bacterium TMED8]|nr:hypothetical protein [Magnetovibrio sp.]OUT51898.1 MAG: hypothetical protein CBB68_03210 [Rhodospirillaceae bacterium TMED8]
MSEETAQVEDGQQPSMEEILDSIRRILSDEKEEIGSPASPVETQPQSLEPEPEAESHVEQELLAVSEVKSEDETALHSGPSSLLERDLESGSGSLSAQDVSGVAGHSSQTQRPPMPTPMEAMLELTPEMLASDILSQPTAKASTDVLSELAAAILDRRDLAVDTSRSDMTLEGIVREMLKPILREWLDRNLPYLIERLVKREIDLMVNRAERLEE